MDVKTTIKTIAETLGITSEAAKVIVEQTSRRGNSTERHKTDMGADNKLSKLIRPLVTIWGIVVFTIVAVMDYLGHPVDPEIISTIHLVLGLSVGFYFPGRTLEKWIKRKSASRD